MKTSGCTPGDPRPVLLSLPALLLASLLLSLTLVAPLQAADRDLQQMRQLAQLSEYIGVDYSEAVAQGRVVNEGEYQEMLEFSRILLEQANSGAELAGARATLQQQAGALRQAIEAKASLETVQQLSNAFRNTLLAGLPAASLPASLLDRASAQQLYRTNCASCHGASGQGSGPAAGAMEPPPTDFTDRERAMNRSVLGLFDAITNGIDDTAMTAFGQLSEQERWSLAFYVGGLAFQDAARPGQSGSDSAVSLIDIVNHNPRQLLQNDPGLDSQTVQWLRGNPDSFFVAGSSPLSVTRRQLAAAREHYRQGRHEQSVELAVSAYLDGFELLENSLDAHDKALRQRLERQMMSLRQLLQSPGNEHDVQLALAEIFSELETAERLLHSQSLSNSTLFASSFVILLREGLEALLVIIALISILVQTKRRSAVKYIHFGWVLALLAGAATWLASQTLISVSGASREIMEGVAALLAAVILLYVGIWMHSKSSAERWQAYIRQQVDRHLSSGTLWGLSLLAFIAVYREVFETVLFYQALLTQAEASQLSSIGGGFVAAVATLAGLTWLLLRYSLQLPIARFFALTTYVLLALAFILAGKAIMALQEAGIIAISAMHSDFHVGWLGINSTWEGIVAQGAVLLVFAVFILLPRVRGHRPGLSP